MSNLTLCSVLITNYYTSYQIKKYEMAGHVARIGERRGSYRILVGELREGNHLEDSA